MCVYVVFTTKLWWLSIIFQYNTKTTRKPLTQFEVTLDPFDITLKLVYNNVNNNNFTLVTNVRSFDENWLLWYIFVML